MPGSTVPLTDEELLAVADDPQAVAKFSSEERRRLTRIKPVKPSGPTLVDRAVDALPAVGGALGGIVGGIGGTVAGFGVGGVPGAVGGAAVGGAGGEGFRQAINAFRGKPLPTAGEQATDIAKEAALQGGSELVGAGVMKGAKMAAHGLMDFAIRPAPTVAEEFGDIAGTALKERLPVGSLMPNGVKGSQLAKTALRESAGTTRSLLTDAGRAGVEFSPEAIARGPVTEMVGQIAKQPLSDSELAHVSRLFSEYLNTQNSRMAPLAVKDMKQAAQRIAKPILKALNAGNVPSAGEALKAQFNKAVADGAKDALETIPGVAASESRTQGLIGASKAIRRAESRRLPLAAELAAPVVGGIAGGATTGDSAGAAKGVTAAVLTRALMSPRSTSRQALTLTTPAIQQAIRQMPRAAVYKLLEQVTGTASAPEQ